METTENEHCKFDWLARLFVAQVRLRGSSQAQLVDWQGGL